ncbi:MAG: putative transporter [Bacteroidales bacterium]
MEWIGQLFNNPTVVQSVLLLCVVSALGLSLGRVKIFGISLGVTFVFFIGIVAGHFGFVPDPSMLGFAQSFGLILFVYALGLQVGPGFFSSFRNGGIKLTMLASSVVAIGLILSVLFHKLLNIPIAEMMGILSGAVTNTPALGAAQQTLDYMRHIDVSIPSAEIALGCAVAYPLGVVGVIMALAILNKLFPSTTSSQIDSSSKEKRAYIASFQITNNQLRGKTVKEVATLSHKDFVISRLWRDGKVTIPNSETTFSLGDRVLVMTTESDAEWLELLFGAQEEKNWNDDAIDWNMIDSNLVSRRILVTQQNINGKKLGALRLRNLYGVNVTRVNRSGIELLPNRDLLLQMGDKLTVVGEKASISNVEKVLGNSLARLKEPNLIAIFIGIVLGLILGSVPISIPGVLVPIKLGIAGGPIVVGILMGAFGPRFSMITYTTQSANLMLRQIGITLYLAGLGMESGGRFVDTILRPEGALWIIVGFVLTILPVLIVGVIALKRFKLDLSVVSGMLCGSMSNPMALNYANSNIGGDQPSVSYATVYPIVMFLRVITAQLLLTLFL